MNNLEIAELLRSVAAAYQLKDDEKNKFKIIAYQRAADAVEHLSSEAKDIWDEGKLKDVGGIGESIASHLDEIFRTGKSKHFEEVTKGIPSQVFELMKVPGIGVKTAFKLVGELKISDKDPLGQLKKLAGAGEVSGISGFGEDSQASILKSIEETKGREGVKRYLLPYAANIADEIVEYLKKSKNVVRVDPLGSLRRKASTIGDIDLAVASKNSGEVIDYFIKYPKVGRVIEKGSVTASISLPGAVRVDLLVGEPGTYGSVLQHFTGSKHHNVALREYALKHGMSLSEYGIKVKGKIEKFSDEESFYKKLGMEFVPPEIREDAGEIQAALEHKIPKLVEFRDVKGDLQIHSDFNIETSHDVGASSMEEMVETANELGYDYIAFTEHNPSKSRHSQEEIVDLLKRKREVIDKLNLTFMKGVKKGVKKVFNSLEIDILPDGTLPVPYKGLDTLDFALVSIHSAFDLSRDKMTRRVLSAFEYPKVKIFAHPTARKLNEREGVDLEWGKIFEAALSKDIWLEINADPARLDLPDNLVHEAVGRGVKLTLGTDAHHKDGLRNMQYGVWVARRGWAKKGDIMNTLSLKEFEERVMREVK